MGNSCWNLEGEESGGEDFEMVYRVSVPSLFSVALDFRHRKWLCIDCQSPPHFQPDPPSWLRMAKEGEKKLPSGYAGPSISHHSLTARSLANQSLPCRFLTQEKAGLALSVVSHDLPLHRSLPPPNTSSLDPGEVLPAGPLPSWCRGPGQRGCLQGVLRSPPSSPPSRTGKARCQTLLGALQRDRC